MMLSSSAPLMSWKPPSLVTRAASTFVSLSFSSITCKLQHFSMISETMPRCLLLRHSDVIMIARCRSYTDLLENGESSLGCFLESNALVILLLQGLLSSLAAAADGLGVELEIGAAGVHVEELRSIFINSMEDSTLTTIQDRNLRSLTQHREWPRRMVWTSCRSHHRQSHRRQWRGWTRPGPRTPPASSRRR